MKERVSKTHEFISQARYLFELPNMYDDAIIQKKYRTELAQPLAELAGILSASPDEDAETLIKDFLQQQGLKPGEIMPLLRICMTGIMQGPDLMGTIRLLGSAEAAQRIRKALPHFDSIVG
ncbi:MAG: hypothetical protein LW630_08940 [Saprospiraceae bacterium]|nr:hypothetical protein [Saprospiraceae bacterium]